MSQAITEAMVKAARDAFKAKCGITIYLPGEGTLDDFEMERYDALKDALSAALAAAQARPAVVKPLEWEEFKTDFKRSFQANTVVGQYQIGYLGEFEEWQLYSPGAPSWKDCFTRHASVSAAKIAARVAYEARIRSALSADIEKENAELRQLATRVVADAKLTDVFGNGAKHYIVTPYLLDALRSALRDGGGK